MANPLLYGKRYSMMLTALHPGISREDFEQAFDRTNTLVNAMVGIANEVARLAISDGMDALRATPYYRQRAKQLCRETLKRQEQYESIHNRNFGDRLKLWLDYLDSAEDEYRRHIFNIYMAVKQVLDRHRQRDAELKVRLECGRVCALLAVAQFDALMDDMRQKTGIDFTGFFDAGRYDKPLHTWQQLCDIFSKDNGAEVIDLNKEGNVTMAADILARKLNDSDVLNRIGASAISHNIDVARKYASDEDLRELGFDGSDGQASGSA